ncbi:hypothetical protein [Maridesulfovibrio sp.]|uniref:hypothetical protein n=1 Tax=Maridesulfovibrio sp. TaxID=2795000 RepID=UPI002A18BC7B|nr:hypothetical protein [Maridesulfovibrio sp.]
MSYSDWDLYNCSEDHEERYVVGLFKEKDQPSVQAFLRAKCKDNTIYRMRHDALYALIEKELKIKRK